MAVAEEQLRRSVLLEVRPERMAAARAAALMAKQEARVPAAAVVAIAAFSVQPHLLLSLLAAVAVAAEIISVPMEQLALAALAAEQLVRQAQTMAAASRAAAEARNQLAELPVLPEGALPRRPGAVSLAVQAEKMMLQSVAAAAALAAGVIMAAVAEGRHPDQPQTLMLSVPAALALLHIYQAQIRALLLEAAPRQGITQTMITLPVSVRAAAEG